METRSRFSNCFFKLRQGEPIDWIAKPHSFALIAACLFIMTFGFSLFQGWQQFEAAKHDSLANDITTANLLADLLLEHNKATMGILQSYAYRLQFINAVRNRDRIGVTRHLSGLKQHHEIDLTFVTDTRGVLLVNFPFFPESVGKDLSYRDWYKGVSSRWRPYISNIFRLIVGDRQLAVAVCVPIFDERENVIGVLGTTQRLVFVDDAIKRVPLSPGTTVSVTDRTGQVIYSNEYPYYDRITLHPYLTVIETALKAKRRQVESDDRSKGKGSNYLTVAPVGDIGWTIVVERPLAGIQRAAFESVVWIISVSLLLFLLLVFLLAYLRKSYISKGAEELLKAEAKIRQSQETERETREYLESLMKYANAPIIVWNPRFEITRFNRAFEKLTGLKEEEVLGKEIGLLFPDDRREECLAHIRQTTGGERWEIMEIPILHRDGSVHTVLWNSATLYSQDGKTAVATIAQGYDISDRKRAEEDLHRSEEKYRLIADNADDWVYWIDPAGNLRYSSPSCERVTGYSPGEFTYNPALIEEIVHPEDKDLVVCHSARVKEDSKPDDLEFRIIKKNGEVRWIRHSCSPIYTPDKGYAGRRGTNRDITERKHAEKALTESEERYRTIIENAVEGIYQTTLQGKFMTVNPAYLRMLGYESAEELMESVRDIARQLYVDPGKRAEFIKQITEEGSVSGFQLQLYRKDKSVIWVSTTARIVRDDTGVPLYLEGIVEDITERKKAETELQRLNAELMRSNRDLEQFAYVASHDLQEPLRMVSSYTQLLAQRYYNQLDQDAHDFINYAVDGANRMQRLILDLLAFSRVTTRGNPFAQVDLHDALGEAIANLSAKIQETAAVVSTGELPEVNADRSQMTVVFQNLIDNAIKFRKKDEPPHVHVTAEKKGMEWILSVRDNGIGIDPAYFNRIFTIFQRLHTQKEYPGTGIGLAICQKIIDRHGGRIWVESVPQDGATFRFILKG